MTNQQPGIDAYLAKIGEMGEAVTKQNLDALMSHYADDCVYVNGSTGETAGKSAIADFMTDTFAAFPDFTPSLAASHLQGNTLAAVLEATITLPGDDGRLTPGNPQVQWLFTAFYEFDPSTLKVVREVCFADEEAVGKKIEEAAGLAA